MGAVTDTDDSDDDDLDVLTRVKKAKKEADKTLSSWRDEARVAYDFVAGNQINDEDRQALEGMMRVPVVFNRIGPMIDSVSGSEVNNRQEVRYMPRSVGDTRINEVLSGAADYVRDNCDAEDEESDAFLDAVICGVGVTEISLDYTDNPDGAIKLDRRDPLTMRWDQAAKKRNLADRTWQHREDWMTEEEIEAKWPDKFDSVAGGGVGWGDDDAAGGDHNADMAWLYEKDASGYDRKTGKYRVIHHQWFELETYHMVLDPMSGQLTEVTAEQWEQFQARAAMVGMPVQSVTKQRKKYKQAFVAADTVLEESDCPCNAFSYNFITAKRDRNRNIWYGIVRPMIDPQRWANKFFSQVLHIINTNAKGGMVVEESATDNLRKFKEDWAKSDSVVVVNDGAISGGKIQAKQPPAIPNSINDMLQFSISSLRDVTGINLELLGMADRQQAGVLEAQRKQAAMTVLATLFDALRRYRKESGRTMAKYIMEYMSDGRLVRILTGDGTEKYVPLLREQGVLDYDVVVDEASTSINNKERTYAILMQMLPNLAQLGVPFSADLLEYSPLPSAMVEKWKALQEQAQQNKQPDPQMLTAQANLVKAQSGAQKAQADAQQAQAELPIKSQELAVRSLEANVARLQAMVEAMLAQAQLAQLNPAMLPAGQGMPYMPGMPQ